MPKVEQALLEAQDWGRIRKRLVLFAYGRLGGAASMSLAEDIAQEAIEQLLDPDYRDWDPEAEPNLLGHLGSIVNGLVRNHHRKASNRLDVSVDSPAGEPPHGSIPPVGGESAYAARDEARKILDHLLRAIESDEVAQNLVLIATEGVVKPQEQAQALGIECRVVYKARERLAAARRRIEEQLKQEGA